MTRTVGIFLVIFIFRKVYSQMTLKVGGLIQGTGIGSRGKFAFELWRDWANANAAYTVELSLSEYDGLNDTQITAEVQSMTLPGVCESSSTGCVDVLVCPYTSLGSDKVIAAVPSGSPIAILVWGGSSVSLFSNTCVSRSCFGSLTAASMYMTASLSVVADAARTPLTVAAITNQNGFSRSVDAGGKAYIASHSELTLTAEYQLTVSRTSLTPADRQEIQRIVDIRPDVIMISGHPGDVEEVIEAVRGEEAYQPKAIIATNAFSNVNGLTTDYMEGVIMPEQWAQDPVMRDSIVGWTSPIFTQALEAAGHTASYHAAAAGGLAVMLSHAMAQTGATPNNIASVLTSLPATETFYGSMRFNSDGSIDASTKPMYGRQALGKFGYHIVAPTGPLEYPLEQPQTCLEVRERYRLNECCGNPAKVLDEDIGRRLGQGRLPKRVEASNAEDALLAGIQEQMQILSNGGKNRLAQKIVNLVNQLE